MVSVVVINYKNVDRTVQYLRDLYTIVDLPDELTTVIVDNSEEDDVFDQLVKKISKEWNGSEIKKYPVEGIEAKRIVTITKPDSSLILVQSRENGGFAKGNNLGYMIAERFSSPEKVLFSNNDICFPERGIIKKLSKKLDELKDTVIISPKIVGTDGIMQTPYKKDGIWKRWIIPCGFWFVVSILRRLRFIEDDYFTDLEKNPQTGYVYRIMGSFFMVRTELFNKMERFDEKTFLFAEEMILAERSLGCGFGTYYYDDIKVIHEQGFTINNYLSNRAIIRNKLNSELYYFRHYRGISRLTCFLARKSVEFFITTKLRDKTR